MPARGRLPADFLLHNMGSLGDNGLADPLEMRTAPLWGLHFVDAKHQLLYDGRATSLPDAIARHDGPQPLTAAEVYKRSMKRSVM